ncbi:Cupin 2, conserved barrel (plasmid) [Nitrobacter hamburgensis X14]|uniref:Cupin 2, conserved barrel n=1 Tax=Nitrobacter hamburgensis (strain DSM 10229 / NCIMB 13809 / X14) TaxID=323097 RepID=Q1QG00_NITHX|nr:cupin [Nitrobacter hamburgensis]ABE64847.1 Cupin 2, conserved barrel [Nitrobacter hamburgensis X14]
MPIVEDLKEYAERATGLRRPGKRAVANFVRQRNPHGVRFRDDGLVPNHPRWPLILYRGAVHFDERLDPAAVFEDLFEANGWGDTWRNGIYDYVHYHSRIHEALGIARGKARVRFGGKTGRTFALKAGDVAVLPAGTGHRSLSASADFLVVGAYPPTGTYDVCTSIEDRARALGNIPRVLPRKDPVYGKEGPLSKLWRRPK